MSQGFPDKFIDRLTQFIRTYQVREYKNIDVTRKKYTISFLFRNFETRILISFHKRYFKFKIKNNIQPTEPCLDLKILHMDSNLYAELSYIRANNSCQVPTLRAGTWLVALTDELLCILGIPKSTLQDKAYIQCQNLQTRLLFIRIYNGQKSWYQDRFNYHIDYNSTRLLNYYPLYTENTYNFDINSLINMPIQLIVENIEHLMTNTYTLDDVYNNMQQVIENSYNTLQTYPPSVTEKLGNYMNRIWKTNCISYIHLQNFLELTSDRDVIKNKSFPWSHLYQRILDANHKLIKSHTCL